MPFTPTPFPSEDPSNQNGSSGQSVVLPPYDPKASEGEAQTGSNNTKWMTPLRTFQAIASWASSNLSLSWGAITDKPSTFPPSEHGHAISDVYGLGAALGGKQPSGDYATLVNGTIPSAQLPSYVDEILEYADLNAFPIPGTEGKIYAALDTSRIYRWSGSTYVEVSPSSVQSVAGKTGAVALYSTDITDFASAVHSLNTTSDVAFNSASFASGAATIGADGTITAPVFKGVNGAGGGLDNGDGSITPSYGGSSGTININGGAATHNDTGNGGNAGSINLSGGNCASGGGRAGNGGSIDLSGGSGYNEAPGGSIITRAGGGSIDTTGTGSIELGFEGSFTGGDFGSSRTRIYGTATEHRDIAIPNMSGTLVVDPGSEYVKGVANGIASLDSGGRVPTSQLPSYVDDILEFANLVGFPATGESGKIYTALDTNRIYRWSGSTYVEVSPNSVLSVAGKTGAVTLVVGDVSGAAPLASPTFTGTPAAPTPASNDNSTRLATTSFVQSAIAAITVLTGLSTATNTVVTSADSILTAIGKLQAQVNSRVSTDGTVTRVVQLTQAQYNALTPKVSTTLYLIVG